MEQILKYVLKECGFSCNQVHDPGFFEPEDPVSDDDRMITYTLKTNIYAKTLFILSVDDPVISEYKGNSSLKEGHVYTDDVVMNADGGGCIRSQPFMMFVESDKEYKKRPFIRFCIWFTTHIMNIICKNKETGDEMYCRPYIIYLPVILNINAIRQLTWAEKEIQTLLSLKPLEYFPCQVRKYVIYLVLVPCPRNGSLSMRWIAVPSEDLRKTINLFPTDIFKISYISPID